MKTLKGKQKKIEGDRKKQIFQTGGGARASCSVAPDTHNTLLGILGVSAVGLSNPFDGDKPGNIWFFVTVLFWEQMYFTTPCKFFDFFFGTYL